MVVAGRQLDDGDVAVMMVEAGGTEHSFEYYEDGAPKVDEAALARGLEVSKEWIKAAIALQNELVATVGGKKPTMSFAAQTDYTEEQFAAVKDQAGEQLIEIQQIAEKADRTAAEGGAP